MLEETVTKLGMEHMLTRNEGKRLEEVIIDVDAMPLDAHGKQEGCEYNGYYKRKVFLPLIASCGETGDVLGAELRPGTQREVTDCDTFYCADRAGGTRARGGSGHRPLGCGFQQRCTVCDPGAA